MCSVHESTGVGAGATVGAAVHSDGPVDEGVEHFTVNVVEAFDIETSLPDLVRTKAPQQLWIPLLDAADEIQDEALLAR
jgi:hypothetical protein